MDIYGRSLPSASASPSAETGLEESMWELGLAGVALYPVRPDVVDCAYYMQTGSCGYGAWCRFNHPCDRSVIAGAVGSREGYPERVGQPVCQYFSRTGTCDYGARCKYHHPRYGHLLASTVSLNYLGFPLRPGEKECSYYVRTGQCRFGGTCKYHHPEPASTSMSPTAPAFYPTVQSPAVPSPSQAGVNSWQVARPPSVTTSYVPGPYNSLVLSPAVFPYPGWGPYSPPVSPMVNIGTQQTVGTGWSSGLTQHLPSLPSYTGPYTSISSSAGPSSSHSKEHMFPERPGQPECQFYMRTGDCKFGSSCRYHHPPQWNRPNSNCALNPIGLPLRPGTPACTFYLQHGYCKFGPTCKFDHPMGTLSYSPSASSLTDMPVAPYPVGLSLGVLAPSSGSELRREFVAGSTRDSSSTRMLSSENTSRAPVGSIFSKSGVPGPQSHIHFTSQSSIPPSGSSGMGRGSQS
ncbi:hypothetical protein MRB53_031699 [Persea americana]|uniref:Uncharacterized protein n=1 Tax=Persea americana TaxID=3435 RepID=A0ACC2KQ74_PERAE|nr:hypothetical protein MRB53_031699 [Persea americana]|eukprot:TRINITY_DN2175_c0_g4_i3.p1 TRINITY_DN2175_c0_g4~~TRINITY_DN2175_c0_g4_i3.p1  ORF type:complete len:462 (-),score=45.96 TRINITY_DN2175_c0_g4_i3:779-2164(-)